MADGDIRFKIAGKTYNTATIDQISLRDVVTFNSQAADIGLGVTWHDVERISTEMEALTKDDDPHPESLVMFAVTVWAARRIAGEDVTLGEALDVPMSSIEVVEAPKAPKDRQPKAAKKKARPAGVPVIGGGSGPSPSETTTPQTSTQRSVTA